MELGLEGKVAVVTGATANIGRGIALELAANGMKLVAVGRDGEAGAGVVAAAKQAGAPEAMFAAADMLDYAAAPTASGDFFRVVTYDRQLQRPFTGGGLMGRGEKDPSYEVCKLPEFQRRARK